ncbi:MAG: repressor LexA [Candidatus Levybacteria bacterium CG10_big_fil_rev_8_21_14_0_10_36_7]|nr:MAG: repressor LexA [Candidatus Levybacteria bacterium CG10_big_fil_rev_8_21_14_0_10_36_7]
MEQDILTPLKKYFRKNRRLPSYSEMLKIFGVASKRTIYQYVQELMDEGFLQKVKGKLAPTKRFFGIPLLGNIQAGYPILAQQDKSYLTLDEYFIEKPDNSFLLRVTGDSMINAGIFEGDLVVVEQKGSWKTEDIVLAEIDNQWTLKILKTTKGKNYLEAANPAYPPFYPKSELKIHGVVKAVLRKMGKRIN